MLRGLVWGASAGALAGLTHTGTRQFLKAGFREFVDRKERIHMEMIGLMGILGFFSWEDIRKRSIHLVPLVLAAMAGVVLHMYFERITIWSLLGGGGIGMIMYGISLISGEKIGKGDALLLGVTGIFLGFWANLVVLWIASCLIAAGGVVAVLVLHKGKEYELPFVPFLFAGFVIYYLLERGGMIGC